MATGDYTYDPEDDAQDEFTIEWLCDGEPRSNHDEFLEATAEEVADHLYDALAIGEHIKLDNVQLRLTNWETPMVRVWLRMPAGHVDDEEKSEQRTEFYHEHNAVHNERIFVNSTYYDINIDVRQF